MIFHVRYVCFNAIFCQFVSTSPFYNTVNDKTQQREEKVPKPYARVGGFGSLSRFKHGLWLFIYSFIFILSMKLRQ